MSVTRKKQRGRSSLVELITIVAVALGLALAIQALLIKPFRIPSESMVPTLEVGQRVLVDRVSYRFGDPDPGDIVVFKPPRGADQQACGTDAYDQGSQPCPRPTPQRSNTNFIKRVVAVGGDRVSIDRGHVVVNGRVQKEPYINPRSPCRGNEICNLPQAITIPNGFYFMMGDNRGESEDSRVWGPIPKKWMVGKAFVTYWPPGRIGTL